MPLKPAQQMRPGEIIAARDGTGCAFVPVSPCFEWHSYHLPVGTDGLISEGVCEAMAERVSGIYFRPLSLGMDGYLGEKHLLASGFDADEKVYGMRFPALPLHSEYCQAEEMAAAVGNRLEALKQSGFRYAFLVNHHGGPPQKPALNEIAAQWDSDAFRVWSVSPMQFCSYRHESMETGGHAGMHETLALMAFRPELIDLSKLPEGELEVKLFGILHNKPVIEAEFNPRNASQVVADEIRESIIAGFAQFIAQECSLDCTDC